MFRNLGFGACFTGLRRGRQLDEQEIGVRASPRLGLADPLASGANRSSYGGAGCVEGGKGKLTVVPSKRWEWETRGEPWHLLKDAAVVVGQQYAALGVIVLEVFVKLVADAPKRFMNCDGRVQGLALAAVCEGTKSCARFFVLLALVVAAMVAIRMVLRCRIYYEMLRHGAIVNFDNARPFEDPLFVMLVACICFSFCHFATFWMYSYSMEGDAAAVLENVKTAVVFYFAPTAAFMGFLFRSYDTEADLLPLNKYMEEDPDWARANLAHICMINEDRAAEVVQRGLLPQVKGPLEASHLYQALIDVASENSGVGGSASAMEGGSASANGGEDGTAAAAEVAATAPAAMGRRETFVASLSAAGHVPKSAFISTMWPAKVLLDGRLRDKDSMAFRQVWYIFAGIAFPMMVFVLGFFCYQAEKDVEDVRSGQTEDVAGLVVEFAYFCATVYLMHHLYLILSIR